MSNLREQMRSGSSIQIPLDIVKDLREFREKQV